MGDPADAFGLFVSCVEGQPVTRFGTRVLIGAARDLTQPRKVNYDPKLIVAIPATEARRYHREYRRAIANGSLTERTAAEWREQNKPNREVGAPREKQLQKKQPQQAKEPTHVDPEGGSKLG
jgi:hypothetical protein